MSLDVYLTAKEPTEKECYHCGSKYIEHETNYSANITHNLCEMASKAGIYEALWRPEEIGITEAKQLIEPLKKGLADLKARPEYFKQFNAPNGWGMYEHFVPFVEKYLNACKEYPESTVNVSR
jgi:hypothetical protein